MRPDEMRLTYVSLDLSFPPVPRFVGAQLAELYAQLCGRHALENFQAHGVEGATMGTEGGYNLDLRRHGLTLQEHVQGHLDLIKRDFADMVGMVQERLHISWFFEPRVELRALWPVGEDQDVFQAMRDGVLALQQEHFDLLPNLDVRAVGLRLHGDRTSPNGHFDLELMPWVRDGTQLAVEARAWEHSALENASDVEQRLATAYEYLEQHVTKFVTSFMP